MAEEQTGQERTEQPTERRKQEARRRGQVPRSKELNTLLSLLALSLGLLVLGGTLVRGFQALLADGFSVSRELVFASERLPVHLGWMLAQAILLLLPLFAVAIVAAFAGPLAMGGWTFSGEAIAFSLEKLNPVKGIARVFSAKGLVEMLKALGKFLLLLGATLVVFVLFERDILTLGAYEPGYASRAAVQVLLWGLLLLTGTLVFIAALDVPFELWNFNRQLRMTRQEVREELKETDGRPEVRQRIRELQRDVAQRRMMQDVPKADVVITNPTHVAVALRYDEAGGGAPTVVARGRDLVALQIRSVARAAEVPVFEAPPLARALYATTELGQEIPRELYLAVARVLAYLLQLRRAGPTDYVPPPADLEVPEEWAAADNMDEEPADGDQ
ncbi:flagellar biosynthesis protein FlhB [Pseudohaliea sp.]|uniref:flagellar biosynthesis protein FlhB n=1 Tax=Pseudohaliea sp. TaxID=2740289 RepID=UPI0032F05401